MYENNFAQGLLCGATVALAFWYTVIWTAQHWFAS
jgi:hypothetical protein